jgi:large subunit ribosomal protein L17
MPHRTAGRKLSRPHGHRLAMLANLAVAVLRYERVRTTEAKAKEVRGLVDGMITLAKRGDLHARRQLVSKMPHEPLIVDKLMSELAGKYADRASGFTRIVKIGQRPGDAASMVQIELV